MQVARQMVHRPEEGDHDDADRFLGHPRRVAAKFFSTKEELLFKGRNEANRPCTVFFVRCPRVFQTIGGRVGRVVRAQLAPLRSTRKPVANDGGTIIVFPRA